MTSSANYAVIKPNGLEVYSNLETLYSLSTSSKQAAAELDNQSTSCLPICGLSDSSYKPFEEIPYWNILWAQEVPNHNKPLANDISSPIELAYMKPESEKKLSPRKIIINVVNTNKPLDDEDKVIRTAPEPIGPDISSMNSKTGLLPQKEEDEEQQTQASASSDFVGETADIINNNTNKTQSASPLSSATEAVNTILKAAYKNTKPQKRFLVLINPIGGPGKAKQIYEKQCAPILALAHCKATVMVTTHRFHATEIAQSLEHPLENFDAVICCSGDGIPHEVINGFAARPDGWEILKNLPLCQLPCGSGNSMAVSLHGHPSTSQATLGFIKGIKMPIDLMLMTQGTGADCKKTLTFLSQAFGIIADADLGSENLRWMGGFRFELMVGVRAFRMKKYPCDIYIKYAHRGTDAVVSHFNENKPSHHHLPSHLHRNSFSKERSHNNKLPQNHHEIQSVNLQDQQPQEPLVPIASSTESLMTPHFGTVNDPVPEDWEHIDGSSLGLFYSGNMPWVSDGALMFPGVISNDGTFDVLMFDVAGANIVNTLNFYTSIEKGEHVHVDPALYSKVVAYRLVPKKDHGYLSIDGESFPHVPFQVEIVPSCACLLSPTGSYAYTGFGK